MQQINKSRNKAKNKIMAKLYKKYQLMEDYFAQQAPQEDGSFTVKARYKVIDPENPPKEDHPYDVRYCEYEYSFADGDVITWDVLNALVAEETGVVVTYP